MFKRPTIRKVAWAGEVAAPTFTSATHGRVGEIIATMRAQNVPRAPPRPWAPPKDYLFVAQHMHENSRDAYIARCEAWHSEHPPSAPPPVQAALVLNHEPILKLFARYHPHRPPTPELAAAWRLAGYPETRVAKAVAHFDHLEATVDERQKALDAIFVKFPVANKTAKAKVAAKPIKAVKKKMT